LAYDVDALGDDPVAIAVLDEARRRPGLVLLDGCLVDADLVTCDVTQLTSFAVVRVETDPVPAFDAGAGSEPTADLDAGSPAVEPEGDDDRPSQPEPSAEPEPSPEPSAEPESPAQPESVEADRVDQGLAQFPWVSDAAAPEPFDPWAAYLDGEDGGVGHLRVRAGCGCRTAGNDRPLLAGWLLLPAVVLLRRRRARRVR
jgi:MYXO-CTERM domain-containing protein